ncbi:MFS transporter [Pseudonocardia sp. TRM90224]|uniref:MFS transporter n=1 Tax=Pseudonocardia sp. TRM90224 TaxID=2812678 RepID=UPI001E2CBA3D|nr:MFS transporter [Pseudonocardia sp. TRM90224]
MSTRPDAAIPAPTSGSVPLWLGCLALLTFAIGTDDFVIAGVLPALATDLAVTEPAAGQLVTAFSLTYALSAPVMAVVTAGLPRRAVLIGGMAVFTVLNVAAALAPTYPLLMAIRVLAAATAAMMTPAAFATAATLAPPGRTGRSIGVLTVGLTLSLVAGVPAGTWLGGTVGWRSTMVFVAAIAVLVTVGLAVSMPALERAPRQTVRARLAPLRQPTVLIGLVAMTVGAAGGLMPFVYIAPIAAALSGAGPAELAVLIGIAGVAGFAGALLGGRGTDRFGAERLLVGALGGQTAVVAALAVAGWAWSGAVPIVVIGALIGGWGVCGWAFNPPSQARLMAVAGESATEAIALNTSAMYLGISVAGAAGGAALAWFGAAGVLTASAVLGLVSLAIFLVSFRVGGRR